MDSEDYVRQSLIYFNSGYSCAQEEHLKHSMAQKVDKPNFVRLEPVLDILRAAIWTGKLIDEKPASIMLVADQESAKTEALKYFRGTSTIVYISDLTARGINPYKKGIEALEIRHLCLLDLVRVVSHGRSVSDRTLQSIASLMEEGESDTSDGGGRESWKNFPKVGCLMGITTDFFVARRGKWRQTGFMTRFVPVRFNYSEETIRRIHDSIARGKSIPPPRPEPMPPGQVQVFCSQAHALTLSVRAQELGKQMKTYGFRYQKVLRSLAKARALMEKRGTVSDADVRKVIEWSSFFADKAVTL
jgi:hypothetical protein